MKPAPTPAPEPRFARIAATIGDATRAHALACQWVEPVETSHAQYRLTAKGIDSLVKLGVDVSALCAASNMRGQSRRMLYDCMDWSERRDHFAGPLAIKLLEFFIAQNWLQRDKDSRGLVVTTAGAPWLQEDMQRLFAIGDSKL